MNPFGRPKTNWNCSVPGCEKPFKSNGLCAMHFTRMRRHGNTETVLQGKTIKHGYVGTKTYTAWSDMRTRCTSKNNPYYKDYGGRGITVCREWADFRCFLRDMGEAPEGLTLDRIDNDKGYFKGNCRWATWTQQVENRRVSRNITFDGKTMSIHRWERELGFGEGMLRYRLSIAKWPLSQAMTRPSNRGCRGRMT